MRNNNGTLSSTCGIGNDVIGGRKTVETRFVLVEAVAADEGAGGAVLVDLGRQNTVRFSDRLEVATAPSLVTETETETESDEEEEEEWESDEESEEEDEEDA